MPGQTRPCPEGMAVNSVGRGGGQKVVKAAEQVAWRVSPRVTPNAGALLAHPLLHGQGYTPGLGPQLSYL